MAGQYHTAEDMGIGRSDVQIMARSCDDVFGLPTSGNPFPFTARGVFEGLRAGVTQKLGRDTLEGLRGAVQGVGHVGRLLCHNLHEAGAALIVADVTPEAMASAVEHFGAKAVAPEAISRQDADIFSPCAVGRILNDETIPQLTSRIIAGAANNQLQDVRHGQVLHDRGMLYAPDSVINAGGMILASADILRSYDTDAAWTRVKALFDATLQIFDQAQREGRPPSAIADELARQKIAAGKTGKRTDHARTLVHRHA